MEQPKISLLIPFSSTDPIRLNNFKWLLEYWKHELPEAEVVIGKSKGELFCKGEALNNAVKKSKGDILAILDADAYLEGESIRRAAESIIDYKENNLWYVPYSNLYRLKQHITALIIESDPANPLRMPSPVPESFIENTGDMSRYGNRFAAMLMMFSRDAFKTLGCFDERFKGWGGEDVAVLRALDTLYGKHKITKNDIMHLWHPFIGRDYITRKWPGQKSGNANAQLSMKYFHATRSPSEMRKLVDEGCKYTIG